MQIFVANLWTDCNASISCGDVWIPHRDCIFQMWTNDSSIKGSQGCWWSMLLKTAILLSWFWADILNKVRPREVRRNRDSKIPICKQVHAQAQSTSHGRVYRWKSWKSSWEGAMTCICLDTVTACGMITNYNVISKSSKQVISWWSRRLSAKRTTLPPDTWIPDMPSI